MKIIFFGTPEFAVASLDRLVKDGHDIAAVVTMPDKASGRGRHIMQSDVKRYAVENGLRVLQPVKLRDPEFIKTLQEINADLFIVIAFRMLPEIVWGMPRLGTFNLHASLLPKYRGAAPINRAIMNGETETGITTFFLSREIDTGDIIDRRKVEISAEDNAGSLHDKLMLLGAEMVADTVNDIENGVVNAIPQPEGEFTPAPKIFKEDCKINWKENSETLHNLVRGLSPYPAAYTNLIDKNGKEIPIKVYETKISDRVNLQPGEVLQEGKHLIVGTGDSALEILSLQPAGKKRMDIEAFLAGYSITGTLE